MPNLVVETIGYPIRLDILFEESPYKPITLILETSDKNNIVHLSSN